MLECNAVTVDSKFILTPEQRIALMEEKIERAQRQIQTLAELAKQLNRARR